MKCYLYSFNIFIDIWLFETEYNILQVYCNILSAIVEIANAYLPNIERIKSS